MINLICCPTQKYVGASLRSKSGVEEAVSQILIWAAALVVAVVGFLPMVLIQLSSRGAPAQVRAVALTFALIALTGAVGLYFAANRQGEVIDNDFAEVDRQLERLAAVDIYAPPVSEAQAARVQAEGRALVAEGQRLQGEMIRGEAEAQRIMAEAEAQYPTE